MKEAYEKDMSLDERLMIIKNCIDEKEKVISREIFEKEILEKSFVDLIKYKTALTPWLLNFDDIETQIKPFKKKKNYKGNDTFNMFMSCLKMTLASIWDEIDNFTLAKLNIPTIGIEFGFTYKRKKFELFIPYYTNFEKYSQTIKFMNYYLTVETSFQHINDIIAYFTDEIQLRDNIKRIIDEKVFNTTLL